MSAEATKTVSAVPNPPRHNWLSEGILIAAASFVGYLLTYAYEIGLATEFGIPTTLIEVNLNNLLYLITLFGAVAVMIFQIIYNALDDIKYLTATALKKTIVVLLAVAAGGFHVVSQLLHGHGKYRIWFWAIVAVVGVIVFVPPLFKRGKAGKSYSERFTIFWAQRRGSQRLRHGDATFIVWIGLVLLFLIAQPIASEAGRVAAQDMEYFEVLTDESNTVVLRVYADKMVTAKFDPCTKEINGITVQRIGEPPVRLKTMLVGPLSATTVTKVNQQTATELEDLP